MNRNPPQILDDSDDDFDPKTEDIHQYGEIIGLDPQTEGDLLWIAKEGILAKLQVQAAVISSILPESDTVVRTGTVERKLKSFSRGYSVYKLHRWIVL